MGRTASTEPQCLYSKAIPLQPLWVVQPLQSLSACTVKLYFYYPMGRTACTVLHWLYSTAILLLLLWPYGLYTASVPVQYTYTFTTTMGRTVCSEPQCLYSRAVPLLRLWALCPLQSLRPCTSVHFCFYFIIGAIILNVSYVT